MTNTDLFFGKIKTYARLTAESEAAWLDILNEKVYNKGDTVIKYFFPEGRIAGSIPATITSTGSLFTIEALERTTVLEYDFHSFKKLVSNHKDVAEFYINYMERHWIIDKEPYEVSLRSDAAKVRYDEFLQKYPELVNRLKKHHIAAFLGITPTQDLRQSARERSRQINQLFYAARLSF